MSTKIEAENFLISETTKLLSGNGSYEKGIQYLRNIISTGLEGTNEAYKIGLIAIYYYTLYLYSKENNLGKKYDRIKEFAIGLWSSPFLNPNIDNLEKSILDHCGEETRPFYSRINFKL